MSTGQCDLHLHLQMVWRAEPLISKENQISFIPNDSVNITTFTSSGVIFHAVLIQSDPVLLSTLSITASATTNGTLIECIEPFSRAYANSTLQLQGQ